MFDVTTQGAPEGFRGRLGRLAHHVVPDLDQRAYARARGRDRASRLSSHDWQSVNTAARLLRTANDREPHVVVVPTEGEPEGAWRPGIRNLYFEAHQTLVEETNPERVSAFFRRPGESAPQWQSRLIDHMHDRGATHVLTHIEGDPGDLESWTWDSFWQAVNPHWDGVLLGGMFDSSYRFTEAKAKILAKMSPGFVLVDICIPMDDALRSKRREVGPVNMPMSQQSLALLAARLESVEPEFDLSFFGVLYDYRTQLLEQLRAEGLSVAVNPHRADAASDGVSTRANQPSWLDYMAGIARSKATINFSQSNAGPFEQLKTRVMEVGLAGAYLLTDDRDRTRRFWDAGTFSEFDGPDDLVTVSERVLEDSSTLATATEAFGERARFLARHHYWGGIEATLRARGLPSLGIEPFTM